MPAVKEKYRVCVWSGYSTFTGRTVNADAIVTVPAGIVVARFHRSKSHPHPARDHSAWFEWARRDVEQEAKAWIQAQ